MHRRIAFPLFHVLHPLASREFATPAGALAHWRANRGARPDMCVILFSGLWTTESLKLSRLLDVNGVLAKPFSPTKLRDELVAARRRVFPLDFPRYRGVLLPN